MKPKVQNTVHTGILGAKNDLGEIFPNFDY
jgi:hypothetical protein